MAEENKQNSQSDQKPAGKPVSDGVTASVPKKVKTAHQIERERQRRKRRRQQKALHIDQDKTVQKTAGKSEVKLAPKIVSTASTKNDDVAQSKDVVKDDSVQTDYFKEEVIAEKVLVDQTKEEVSAENVLIDTPEVDISTESVLLNEPKEEISAQNVLNDQVIDEDAPLIIASKEAELADEVAPPDLSLSEQMLSKTEINEDIPDDSLLIPQAESEYQTTSTIVEAETVVEESPEPPVQAESEVTVSDFNNDVVEPEIVLEPEVEVKLEPVLETSPDPAPKMVSEPEVVHDVVHEDNMKEENLRKAKEISDSLLGNQTNNLEEVPVKQGFLGKVFDQINEFAKKRKEKKVDNQPTVKEVVEKPKFKFDLGKILPILKVLLTVLVVLALVGGAFWLGSSLKLYDRVMGLFAPKPGQENLVRGDNIKVLVDPDMLKQYGFVTALVFSKNSGNSADAGYDIFFIANYFGKLKEPVFYGETGISAAIYYGFGKDIIYINNRFVLYVKYLEKLQNANTVDVYNVMDGKLRRDEALKKYLTDSRAIFEQGNTLRKEINVQIDDFKVSLNSITPDKDKFEFDFFASLANLEADKADMLIKKFIESAQKQVEIKAKLAAMGKLSEYYEKVLINLKIKLDAVDKNQEALVSGIQVTEVPGVNLNLVKKE